MLSSEPWSGCGTWDLNPIDERALAAQPYARPLDHYLYVVARSEPPSYELGAVVARTTDRAVVPAVLQRLQLEEYEPARAANQSREGG